MGVGTTNHLVVSQPCQVKKHLDDMVEKEKKSEDENEAPPVLHPGFFTNEKNGGSNDEIPKVDGSFYLPPPTIRQELCRGHDEKEPLQPAMHRLLGLWGSCSFGFQEEILILVMLMC